MGNPIIAISLGWGVQSTTLAVMAATGKLEADAVIHADTTHEHAATYEFAQKMMPWLAERGVNVITTKASDDELAPVSRVKSTGAPVLYPPVYGLPKTQISRQCTDRWKIRPVRRTLRSLPGFSEKRGVVLMLGISLDEWHRAKDSDVKYIRHVYPLLDFKMTRADCVDYLAQHGIEAPPKSACVFCPYKSRRAWQNLRNAGGKDWEKAVEFDRAIRDQIPDRRTGKVSPVFIHPARIPLIDAVGVQYEFNFDDPESTCDSGFCFM
jgi:hypothetical protein